MAYVLGYDCRFSPWAQVPSSWILITGLLTVHFFIPTIHSLFDTKYGLALLTKILLFIFMGILGIIHYVKGRMRAQQVIRATVKVEFIIELSFSSSQLCDKRTNTTDASY